jgi:hypothetical protein
MPVLHAFREGIFSTSPHPRTLAPASGRRGRALLI